VITGNKRNTCHSTPANRRKYWYCAKRAAVIFTLKVKGNPSSPSMGRLANVRVLSRYSGWRVEMIAVMSIMPSIELTLTAAPKQLFWHRKTWELVTSPGRDAEVDNVKLLWVVGTNVMFGLSGLLDWWLISS